MRSVVLLVAIACLEVPAAQAPPGRSMMLLVDVTESHHGFSPSTWEWSASGLVRPSTNAKAPLWGPIAEFRDALRSGDRATIGAVADHLLLEREPAATKPEFEIAARRLLSRADAAVRWATTPLWDAVDEGIAYLEPAVPPRMIVLITDGAATGNRLSIEDVARRAKASGVAVHLVLSLNVKGPSEIEPASQARRLAEVTGGFVESYAWIRGRGASEIEGPTASMKKLMQKVKAVSEGTPLPR